MTYRFRSSITGHFVKASYAKRHKATTVRERVKARDVPEWVNHLDCRTDAVHKREGKLVRKLSRPLSQKLASSVVFSVKGKKRKVRK